MGADLDGFKSRALSAGTGQPSSVRHLYATVWEQQHAGCVAPHSLGALLLGAGSAIGALPPTPGGVRRASRRFEPAAALLLLAAQEDAHCERASLPEAEAALWLAAALVRASVPACASLAVWLLTVAAQPSASLAHKADPSSAGPWGLGRSSRSEAPAARVGCLDLGCARACGWPPTPWRCTLASVQAGELEYVCLLRNALVPRLSVAPPPPAWSLQLHLRARGAISLLTIEPLRAAARHC